MPMRTTVVTLIASVVLASPLAAQQVRGAQEQGKDKDAVPAASRPPAGMCRIWVDGVPAAQQPAPTDCATAIRNRPGNARVLFGDDYVDRDTKRDDRGKAAAALKGFLRGSNPDWRKDDKEKPRKP